MDALIAHVRANVPWGARATVEREPFGAPFRVDATGPAFDAMRRAFAEAYGVPAIDVGCGGSIPFLAAFAEAYPEAALLLLGVEDPTSNAHAENESLHLGDFEKACLAEALFFGHLAG
jgi:acetylornithine deacetylase/succinyl-diaminopimelate desuccinylase-like protein